MLVALPELITADAQLVSSSLAETDASEWDSTTAYVAGDEVMVTDDGVHKIYEAIQGSLNEYPPSYTAAVVGSTDAVWLEVSATNRWKMFDGVLESASVDATHTSITFTVSPATGVDTVCLFRAKGASYEVTQSGGYSTTGSLSDDGEDIILIDLLGTTGDISVTITGSGTACALGEFVMAAQRSMGQALINSSLGIRDYSTKGTDSFGRTVIISRSFAKRAQFRIKIESDDLSDAYAFLASYRSTPLVWIGDPRRDYTAIYGYYRDFRINLSSVGWADMTVEVEGLI